MQKVEAYVDRLREEIEGIYPITWPNVVLGMPAVLLLLWSYNRVRKRVWWSLIYPKSILSLSAFA
jgi:hypothetical protein